MLLAVQLLWPREHHAMQPAGALRIFSPQQLLTNEDRLFTKLIGTCLPGEARTELNEMSGS